MFFTTFDNVLLCFVYLLPGFLLGKWKKASTHHLSTLSAILMYALSPCMIVSAFLSLDGNSVDLKDMGWFFGASLLLQLLFTGILFLLLRKRFQEAKYRILTSASVMGNVGFFGLPLIKAILPENPEVVCYATMFVLSMNLLIFTVGTYCVTSDPTYISVKSVLLNPSTLAIAVGLPLYLSGANAVLPSLLLDGIGLLGKMTTPLCMIILGIRLSAVSFFSLFSHPFVYLICLLKLAVFPLFCYACVAFLPLSVPFQATLVLLAGTPCASFVLNLAELHRKETDLSANCVLLSTLCCLLSLPLLSLLF